MDTKVCSKCKEEKPLSEFHFRNKAKGKRNSCCRQCVTKYSKEYYHQNIEREHPRRMRYNRKRYAELRKKYFEYLCTHPCIDCGESDPMVLEFDHVRGVKKRAMATLLKGRVDWSVMLAEIAKCDVVCANCHKRRTAKKQGWYADLVE